MRELASHLLFLNTIVYTCVVFSLYNWHCHSKECHAWLCACCVLVLYISRIMSALSKGTKQNYKMFSIENYLFEFSAFKLGIICPLLLWWHFVSDLLDHYVYFSILRLNTKGVSKIQCGSKTRKKYLGVRVSVYSPWYQIL